MTFAQKDNLLHVGLSWPEANELENQCCGPNITTQFGGSPVPAVAPMGTFFESGMIYRVSGNPFKGNNADTTDDILAGMVLPAGAFDVAGRGLYITLQGMFGATANNKRYRLWVNPTMSGQTVTAGVISGGTVTGAGTGVLLIDSGTQTGNGVGWGAYGQYQKFGATGSNTQYFQSQVINGATHGGISVALFPTQAENAAMNIVVTGASLTTGAANDVLLDFFEVLANN